jgi:hypothetical protein
MAGKNPVFLIIVSALDQEYMGWVSLIPELNFISFCFGKFNVKIEHSHIFVTQFIREIKLVVHNINEGEAFPKFLHSLSVQINV